MDAGGSAADDVMMEAGFEMGPEGEIFSGNDEFEQGFPPSGDISIDQSSDLLWDVAPDPEKKSEPKQEKEPSEPADYGFWIRLNLSRRNMEHTRW